MRDNEDDIPYSQISTAVENIGNSMLRYVLAQCESQTGNTVISRSKMTQKLKDINDEENTKPVPFSAIYSYIDSKLSEIYGYHLFGIPAKKTDKKRPFSETQGDGPEDEEPSMGDAKFRGQYFVLLRRDMGPVPRRYHQFILDHTSTAYEKRVHDMTYIGKEYSVSSSYTPDNEIGNDTELALKGITAITLCIVLLSKNNILETELSKQHEKFGISTDGHQIPIIDMTHRDLLCLLVRNNYLTKTVEKVNDVGQELAIYSIGKRTLVEFPKESLVKLCQETLQLEDNQLELIENTVNLLAGDAYGEFKFSS
ncbi:unnamed protein product [Kluyveromyces dobzhanskii CBS 2104]|uniref:WGS project CCBQ000000000 data, contig 00102 n=1 Tax=Kluyveromyces dobzhanskii CBS 2104 TaxID=1427455 RepID=A0A0A8L3P0_9SACH|nr:unnamed protein product [Kluyveromyces dobzhanskii CBS 2104]